MTKSAKGVFHRLKSSIALLFFVFIIAGLLFSFREVVSGRQIILSTNYLAHFFSPWSTEKFTGWDQGIPNKPLGTDQLRFFYPGRVFANSQIQNGAIPLWNPYIFSGSPNLANFQSAIFYPFNVLYLFLPQIPVWNFQILAIPLIAFIFTYWFLRSLSLRETSAILGAVAFGFSGFILCWMQEALAVAQAAVWLPAILLCIEKFLQSKNYKYVWGLSAILVLEILSGYLQITVYISGLCICYTLFRIATFNTADKLKTIFFLILASIGAFLISSIQIFPSTEALFLSPRLSANIDSVFQTYLLPIGHLIKIFIPDFEGNPGNYNYFGSGSYNEVVLYIGVIPAFFALYSFIKFRLDPKVKFFLLAFLTSFFLTMANPVTYWLLHLPLPLISTFQPSRIFIASTFCLAVLSAFGFDAWQERKKNSQTYYLALGVIVIIILALILKVFENGLTGLTVNFMVPVKNSVLPIGLLVVVCVVTWIKKRDMSPAILILLITIVGQFYFLNRYNTAGLVEFLYPSHPIFSYLQSKSHDNYRFLAFGSPIRENFATLERIYSPEGFDPIFPYNYGQLLSAVQSENGGEIKTSISRIEATMSNLKQGEIMTDNQRRLRLMSLLGVKHILYYDSPDSTVSATLIFPNNMFDKKLNSGKWIGYEFKEVLPRAFLTNQFIVENDPQKIADYLLTQDNDLKTIVLDSHPPIADTNEISSGSAKIITYQPEMVEILTQSDSENLLFLSDSYFPGWKVFIDNKESKIYKANFAFRAVFVPAGNHLVKFKYIPASFDLGSKISLISILIFTLIGIILFKWRR